MLGEFVAGLAPALADAVVACDAAPSYPGIRDPAVRGKSTGPPNLEAFLTSSIVR